MKHLVYQFELLRAMRLFFEKENFTEVITPPIVENPGMEVHIHPFEVVKAQNKQSTNKYLHTSPEFAMKKILADCVDLNDIYTISYVFRDEPQSLIHREQFLMCEWYRKNTFYTSIMQDCEKLISFCREYLESKSIPTIKPIQNFTRMSIQELFLDVLKIDILNFLEKEDLKEKIKKDFPKVPIPNSELSWDDYYFLLFLNEVEPEIKKYPYLLLYNFPKHLSALSTINKEDPRVCDRFEIYMNGIELCNSFNELTNLEEQKRRFEIAEQEKKELYGYNLPRPQSFYSTLEKGLPNSSGIALGVERLLASLTKSQDIFFD